jgi:hypothetical protein
LAVLDAWPRRLAGWWRRRRLERRVEAALRVEAAWLPPPRTAAERRDRAEALAATRAVVLATLTRLDVDGPRSAAGGEKGP